MMTNGRSLLWSRSLIEGEKLPISPLETFRSFYWLILPCDKENVCSGMNVTAAKVNDYFSVVDYEIAIEEELDFLSFGNAVEASLVLSLCLATTVCNFLTIMSSASFHRHREVIDFYVLSISVTNLLFATVVIPFSIVSRTNMFGCNSYFFCSVGGYLHVSLSAVCMYTFMWISVDRYLAVRKQLRYDVIQSRTRCKCWILFTWVMSLCLCCPPLLGDSRGHFYNDSFMCLLNVQSMLPYSVTLGCLVLIPSIMTMSYTYSYMFFTKEGGVKEETERRNTDYIAMFGMALGFIVLWTPWGLLRLSENILNTSLAGPTARFCLLFLGEMHALWTPLTLLSACQRCQSGLKALSNCCSNSATSIPV